MQNSFFMQQAINEALKADPNKVYPNPLVGCVIVKNDKIIGRGHHKSFGTLLHIYGTSTSQFSGSQNI